ncbi:ferredoxin-NADP reductase [Shigella sonnei]|nr:ferredoxin-NADP reductase [Shigella sonnei]
MADWVTGKVTKVQNWTDALFSLTVHAPVLPFTAGQFTKLGLEIDGERVQRAYSYVNSPDNPDLEFYLVTVPDGKLSPRLAALKPGDEVQVVSEAAGFFVLEEVPDCETLWMLAPSSAEDAAAASSFSLVIKDSASSRVAKKRENLLVQLSLSITVPISIAHPLVLHLSTTSFIGHLCIFASLSITT